MLDLNANSSHAISPGAVIFSLLESSFAFIVPLGVFAR